MLKLVVLSAVLAVVAARPGALTYSAPLAYAPATLIAKPEIYYQKSIIEEPTVAHVGSLVKTIPTAVSHQSSTVVHNSAKITEPIYAPAVKQTLVSTPIAKTTYFAAPAAYAYAAPALAYHDAYAYHHL
ncbi:cuticle protein-like [Anopheles merus]|uniref:AGAP006148-PA n=5 Tax=gambiae species complex TaxID=44542 RepID=Q7PNP1_ANOGA|nr:cuticle protein-like [Anopheles coluzzii]XP_041770815.1 cuticle protein-like [Anopheles merus]XP_316208.3 cuticle protein-like [Anopheles gambiae]EAA11845.4 AGAP006148-PA [Anopheles gambiae str. PEST]